MKFTESVKQYYDKNTSKFLRWGADEGTANIHGALWAPGVDSLKKAMHYANQLVAEQIPTTSRPVRSILDLGCGVGSGLFYLGDQLPELERLVGISLSEVQINYARKLAMGQNRFAFITGNFQELPSDLQAVDFAYTIEAFDHSPDAAIFFEQIGTKIAAGGRLVIIDDCLTDLGAQADLAESNQEMLQTYRSNWLMGSLLHPNRIVELAGRQGFSLTQDLDLTPWLHLRRPRDRAISLAISLAGPLFNQTSYLRMLKGGDAKQKCYLRGLTTYRMLVLDKH